MTVPATSRGQTGEPCERGRIEIGWDAGDPVVTMVGEFDMSNAELLHACLLELGRERHCVAIIDMARTRFIDAATLGAIMEGVDAGLRVIVRGANGLVRRLLDIAHIDRVVTLED